MNNNVLSVHASRSLSTNEPVQAGAPAIAYVAGAMQPMMLSTPQIAAATERFAHIEGANFKDCFKIRYIEED